MRAPIIDVRDLSVVLGDREILRQVTLDVMPGEVVALAGPSGSGKSSLLRIILGLIAPSAGTVGVGQRLVSQGGKILVPPEDRNLAMVFQDLALWPHLTVTGNLEFALRSKGVSRKERQNRIGAVLERTGLLDKASRRPSTLSGGERQRVALARALVQEPIALLLDEPLASLDVLLRVEMLSFLRELLRDRRYPVLYVTHDCGEASSLADRVVVMETGRVVQSGSLSDLGAAPANEFVRAFAGRPTREHG